jgi:hypothetical protein
MTMNDYLFDHPNSSEDDYDPSRECFHVEVEETASGDATPVGQGIHTPHQQVLLVGPPWGRAAMSAPERSRWAKLEQLHELEAKINEDR